MRFTKMQGLGNDFVVLNCLQNPFNLSVKQIQLMADRHFGIGFDQLLILEPTQDKKADFHYRVFNPDGKEAGQCGNGARCIGKYLIEEGLVQGNPIVLSTINQRLSISEQANGQMTVEMGIPEFKPQQIPFVADQEQPTYELVVGNEKIIIGVLSMGNPHVVLTVPDVRSAPVLSLGPKIEQHPRFPEKTNVGFMEIVSKDCIRLRVYERGAGETLACGSGACAAVVFGRQQGLLEENVQVELAGGCLQIQWQGPGKPVFMIGPATYVFEGQWLGLG
jgi:diaminopimelate epimerase